MAGAPVGLDFASVMAVGAAQGADLQLLADALPDLESAIIAGLNGDSEED